MTTTANRLTIPARSTTEYALAVDFEDGTEPEIVSAVDEAHATTMARTLYAGRPSWLVSRQVPNWTVTPRSPHKL